MCQKDLHFDHYVPPIVRQFYPNLHHAAVYFAV